MKITIKKNIGKKQYIFDIEDPDFNKAYREAAKMDMLPTTCGVCASEDLSLQYRAPQGYKYPGIKCNSCGATTVISTKKDNSEDYIKPMEKWEKDGKKAEEPRRGDENPMPDDEHIPF